MSTDEADSSNDEVSLDAAMGGSGQDQDTTTHVPEADKISYEEMVRRGAEFLRSGVCEISQIQPKPYHDVTEEEFLDDVQAKLNEGDDNQEETQTKTTKTDANSVDWDALWEEFGFDTRDSIGNQFVSLTQLLPALECTEQACPSGKATVTQAVDDGELHKLTADGAKGETVTRGYVRTQGGDSR